MANEDNNQQEGIGLNQVKYIGTCGRCPACGSKDVQFKLPFEARLETKDGILNRVVLDFTNPQYWLKTTMTKCSHCGFEFHLRDQNDNFYKGLQDSYADEGPNPNIWYYDFDTYKTG
ncbi:MAG: hypothetical protein ACFFCS_27010 [Candidatus Hodarchaeota archaeon]